MQYCRCSNSPKIELPQPTCNTVRVGDTGNGVVSSFEFETSNSKLDSDFGTAAAAAAAADDADGNKKFGSKRCDRLVKFVNHSNGTT